MDINDFRRIINGNYPYPGYNFCMFLDGYKIGFKSVSGLTLKNDSYAPFHESGSNFELEVHRNAKTELNRLTLTKGVGTFNPSKIMSKINVMLMLVYSESGQPVRGYAFSAGYVESVTVSEFDAQDSRVIIDTTVILYDRAAEVDLTGSSSVEAYALQQTNLAVEKSFRQLQNAANAAKISEHNAKVKAKLKELQKKLNKKNQKKRIEY